MKTSFGAAAAREDVLLRRVAEMKMEIEVVLDVCHHLRTSSGKRL